MELSSYITVSTRTFTELDGPLAFDVYLRLGPEKFTKIFSKGLPVETSRLNSYIQKGIHNFHIVKEDRHTFAKVTRDLLSDYLTEGGFNKEGAQCVLDQAAERVLDELLLMHRMDADTYTTTKLVVQAYVHIAKASPAVLPSILKLAKTKTDIFRHSIFTAVFSTLLARSIAPENQALWFNAGLAGLLHDVGLAQIPGRIDEHADKFNPEKKKALMQHPKLSAEAVQIKGLPAEVELAIRCHHENWDGTGYPRGMAGEDIPLLARIVSITEMFSSLTNPTRDGLSLTPALAILAIKKGGKMDPKLVEAFAKMLKIE